jgi:hypothetical protein
LIAECSQSVIEFSSGAGVVPELATQMLLHFKESIRDAIIRASKPDAAGWVTSTLIFDTFEDARENILAFGIAIEVLDPEPLRLSVIDYAKQIVGFYSTRN